MQILIKKMGKTVEMNFDSFPQTTKDYIIHYGLKQSLNDSIAMAKTKDECEAFLAKRIARLVNGKMGVKDPLDKFTSYCKELAMERVKAKISRKANPKEFDSWVEKLMDHPKIQTLARQRIDAEQELEIDFTIGD